MAAGDKGAKDGDGRCLHGLSGVVHEHDDIGETIAHARRRHGAAGAIIAAGMLGLDQVLGRKPREEAPIVISTGDEPVDTPDSDCADGVILGCCAAAAVLTVPPVMPLIGKGVACQYADGARDKLGGTEDA